MSDADNPCSLLCNALCYSLCCNQCKKPCPPPEPPCPAPCPAPCPPPCPSPEPPPCPPPCPPPKPPCPPCPPPCPPPPCDCCPTKLKPLPKPPEPCRFNYLRSESCGEQIVCAGAPVIFGKNTVVSGYCIEHREDSPRFCIKKAGVYQVSFKFNYLACSCGILAFHLRPVPSTRIQEQIVVENQIGNFSMTDLFSLLPGSVIELCFMPCPASTVDRVVITDAVITIRKIDR